MRARKTALMKWVDQKLAGDPALRERVEAALNEMRIEQELVALRERRGMTQRQLAGLIGVSQPQIAKLESGRAKNLELRTLYRWATALGAKLSVGIEAGNGRRRARVAAG